MNDNDMRNSIPRRRTGYGPLPPNLAFLAPSDEAKKYPRIEVTIRGDNYFLHAQGRIVGRYAGGELCDVLIDGEQIARCGLDCEELRKGLVRC